MENQEYIQAEYDTIAFQTPDGATEEYAFVDNFPMGEKRYVLLTLMVDDYPSPLSSDMMFMEDVSDYNDEENPFQMKVKSIESLEEYEKVVDYYIENCN